MILRQLCILLLVVLSCATPANGQASIEDILPRLQREMDERGESWLQHRQDSMLLHQDKKWLSQVYDELGYELDIAPGEYDVYFLGLRFATLPDSQFAQISQMHDVASRDAMLEKWIATQGVSTLPFDKSAWQSDSARHDRRRYRMYKDLRSRVTFEGMSVEELTRILGEPDNERDNALIYDLGPGLTISIGELWFVIENQHVVDKEIRWVD